MLHPIHRPEYVGILLGLSKIGVTAALINTNLTHREDDILGTQPPNRCEKLDWKDWKQEWEEKENLYFCALLADILILIKLLSFVLDEKCKKNDIIAWFNGF